MSNDELVAAWIGNVRQADSIEHIGALNRHFTKRTAISDELLRRGNGAPDAMRPLLADPDPSLRYLVALEFRSGDPQCFRDAMTALQALGGEIGQQAASILAAPPLVMPGPVPRLPPGHPYLASAHLSPPPAMTRDEIALRLKAILPDQCDAILQTLVPAIDLWPQATQGELRNNSSRLGGPTFAPADWEWPMVGSEPMLFIGQIDCADINGLPKADGLPSEGLFALFGDHDTLEGCLGAGGAVFYWPPSIDLVEVAPALDPQIEVLPAALAFRPRLSLPDPNTRLIHELLPDHDAWRIYRGFHAALISDGIAADSLGPAGHLLGHATLVQDDSFALELDQPFEAYRLLLQINDYTNGEDTHGWGPGGSLYVFIPHEEFSNAEWESAELAGQFT